MKQTVLFVSSEAKFFASHRLPLAVAAQQAGYKVVIVSPRGLGLEEILATGLPWHEWRVTRTGSNPVNEFVSCVRLIGIYHRLQPMLVHQTALKPIIYGTLAAKFCRVPIVINAISGMGFLFTGKGLLKQFFGRLLYRVCVRHSNMKLIVQNSVDEAAINALVPNVPTTLIPGSGVDPKCFPPAVKAPQPIVMQASRIIGDKGVREFIAAAKLVRESHPEIRFVLLGNLDKDHPTCLPQDELERAIARGDVEWWGYKATVANDLKQARVFCLPSYREGFPKSLVEAALTGVPIVTCDVPGCRDVVSHLESGILVPPKNAVALADAIRLLLDDNELASRLAGQARARALSDFSLETVIGAHLSIYREAIEAWRKRLAAGRS